MKIEAVPDPKGNGWAVVVNGTTVDTGMTREQAEQVVAQTLRLISNAEIKPVSREKARDIFGRFNDWPMWKWKNGK